MNVQLLSKNNIFLIIFFLILAFLAVWVGSNEFIKKLPSKPENINYADTNPDQLGEYYVAKVTEIIEQGKSDEFEQEYEIVKVKLLNGPEIGKEFEIRNDLLPELKEGRTVKVGEKVILNQNSLYQDSGYVIAEKYRISAIIIIFLIFISLVVISSGIKGIRSIAGLAFSIFVLIRFVVPAILAGKDALTVSIIGALVIATASIYLAHGFSRRTTLAAISTLITITISALLAGFYVYASKLFGLGSEESYFLQFAEGQKIDMRGLLLGGIIFGALGVLDDVTTAQTAAIDEIKNANPRLGFDELYKRGLSVGKEHIASLINTLALAYIGSSFPILLLFTLNKFEPVWIALNGEFIAEEIIRTLVGSSALVLAVPISTFIASRYLKKKSDLTH